MTVVIFIFHTACSLVGDVNATVHSQRNETCRTVVNFTTIAVCEEDSNELKWREICDETFTQQDANVLCKDRGFSDTGTGTLFMYMCAEVRNIKFCR